MKYHKNIVEAIIHSLEQVFRMNKYADKVLEKAFKTHPQWGSRDRKFIAESVYDITRNYRLFSFIAQTENNFRMIFAVYLHEKKLPFPPWQDYQTIDVLKFENNKKQISSPAILFSYPDVLWELCIKELGEERWNKESEALNQPAKVVLRTNTLKTSKDSLIKNFSKDEIAVSEIPGYSKAIVLEKRQNIFSTRQFKEGLFEVQDAGSQLISEFLDVEPGQKIIDACAGAGGKSLHLADLTKNKGKIIALDVEQWKLDNLQKRAKRAGVHNIETRLITGTETINSLASFADRLLLDVPCSGTGVIKRNPDTKYKITPEIIEKTKTLQQQILSDYSCMLKPNGLMVYSTCSILPSENQMQVDVFLKANTGKYSLIKDKTLYPSEGFDGFYMALIRKNA